MEFRTSSLWKKMKQEEEEEEDEEEDEAEGRGRRRETVIEGGVTPSGSKPSERYQATESPYTSAGVST